MGLRRNHFLGVYVGAICICAKLPRMKTLRSAILVLKKERKQTLKALEKLDAALTALGTTKAGPRRRLSASARKRISLAQKARWAKVRAKK